MTGHRLKAWRLLLGALAAVLCLMAAPRAQAGMLAPCAEPLIFPDAEVNLVLLPYALNSPGLRLRQDSFALWDSEGASALSSMMQFDALYSLHYPASLAVVQLFAEGGDCALADVKPRIEAMLKPGKAAVFLWGGLVEREGQIFIQSYVEFLRKDRPEPMAFDMPSPEGRVRFQGDVPQNGIGLPPHVLSVADMEAIRKAAATSRVLSAEPGGPPAFALPAAPEQAFAFVVTGTDDRGWMRIRAVTTARDFLEPGPSRLEGWLPARPEWDLRAHLPEMGFVDGVIGFVTARILDEKAEAGGWDKRAEQRYDQTRKRSAGALARFIDTTAGADMADIDARTAIALARAMRAALALNGPPVEQANDTGNSGRTHEMVDAAILDLEQATAQIPYHPQTRNLLAIGLAARAVLAESAEDARRAATEWQVALSMAPDDKALLANMSVFYQAWGSARLTEVLGLSPEEIAARQAYLGGRE